MGRLLNLCLGLLCLLLGAIGAFLPLLPTVPFMLLAAFWFARSSPRLEAWLLDHPVFGPHIGSWRTNRTVSRSAKRAAWSAFAASALLGYALLPGWWSAIPPAVAGIGSLFIAALRENPR